MEKLTKDLNTQLQLLKFTVGKSKGIVEKGNAEGIERQRDTLRVVVKRVEDLKVEIEQAKLADGENMEDVTQWSLEVENQQGTAEEDITHLNKCLEEEKLKVSLLAKQSEEALVEQAREKQLQFERAQLELKLDYEKKLEDARKVHAKATEPQKTAKLPKLTITKFKGELTDWLRFWSQFEAEIDRAEVPGVTKFSYLKELVDTKVKAGIDGLPFTTEGYERAKNILKTKYGKTSEVVNAYVQNIMSLPAICGTQPERIHDFHEKLLSNVQSLETMGKLGEVNGYVRTTIDKLEGIRSDLVRTDDSWQEWKFPQLVEALRKWVDRNPIPAKSDKSRESRREKPPLPRDRFYQTQQTEQRTSTRGCVYCDGNHWADDCDKVTTLDERKRFLANKRLCFNCTGSKHRADECRSRMLCRYCQKRHHTSICDRKGGQLMTAKSAGNAVIYPVVVIEVEGVRCRALLDTGAGSSYASAALLDRLPKRAKRKEIRRIEMMLGATTKQVEISSVNVKAVEGDFGIKIDVTRVERAQLLTLENPNYDQLLKKYQHLHGIQMIDMDKKPQLPIHVILGASEYASIKTSSVPRVGRPGEPVAEKTKFGWTLLSAGTEIDTTNMLLTQTSQTDYERLCALDVLGLEDSPEGDQEAVYSEFKEQLKRSPEGWYESGLPWKGNHPPLPNNEQGSLRRLSGLIRKLEKQNMLEKYDAVIKQQMHEGIVEPVTSPAEGIEFYLPHKPVIRESAETTKLRVVYDASARAHSEAPSLNECLNPGPPLQNQLWKVLTRVRFHPVAVAGDIKQAFLQVRIREQDRNALRFHWLEDLQSKRIQVLRFTRVLFGLSPSPFLLGGVIQQHLSNCGEEFAAIVREIERSLYVDDLITGGSTREEANQMKINATEMFARGTFELHKWHSNVRELEPPASESGNDITQETYAKQQLGVPDRGEEKLLGLAWDKEADELSVTVPAERAETTKRGVLGKIVKIYDPLGLAAPVTMGGKVIYRDICNQKQAWDAKLSDELAKRWSKWESGLPVKFTVPRALTGHQEPVKEIALHAFGDASAMGVAAQSTPWFNKHQGKLRDL